MSYSVGWPRSVMEQSAGCFLAALDDGLGAAFTDAVNWLETQLRRDPFTLGESRSMSGARRIVVEYPVVIEFKIRESERTVVVTALRCTGR